MADRPIIFSAPMIRALLDGRKTQTRRVLKPQPPEAPDPRCAPSNTPRHAAPYLDAYCGEKRTPANPRGMSRDWHWWQVDDRPGVCVTRAPCAPGDRLYVREGFCLNPAVRHIDRTKNVIFRADVPACQPPIGDVLTLERLRWCEAQGLKWLSSIHMPRWASRLTLTVTDVRVQRLQDISEADAWAEGCKPGALNDRGEPFPAEEPHPKGGEVGWDCARDWFADLWDGLHGPDAWAANPWVVALTFDVLHGNIDHMPEARR